MRAAAEMALPLSAPLKWVFAHRATADTHAPWVENAEIVSVPVMLPERLDRGRVNVTNLPARVPVRVHVEPLHAYVPVPNTCPDTVKVHLPEVVPVKVPLTVRPPNVLPLMAPLENVRLSGRAVLDAASAGSAKLASNMIMNQHWRMTLSPPSKVAADPLKTRKACAFQLVKVSFVEIQTRRAKTMAGSGEGPRSWAPYCCCGAAR